MKSISLSYSPCPNDTFMFDALVNKKISSEFRFDIHLADVEQLNKAVRNNEPDISKISFSNYPSVSNKYLILNAGSAMGAGCGPLLISKNNYSMQAVDKLSIAIPGQLTTANLLLSMFFPDAVNKKEIIFSEIEKEVMNEHFDAGLIIHENRFTYASRGLKKIADLGELWEKETASPIPLGCIVIKRSLGAEVHQQINLLIRESIQMAFDNPEGAMSYVKQHAQEMDEHVMKQHIGLYVNKFSLDLGTDGKKAIELLFEKGRLFSLLGNVTKPMFAA